MSESHLQNRFRTTLAAGVSGTDLSFQFDSVVGLELPVHLVFEPEDNGLVEIVLFDGTITGNVVTTTTLANRGIQGSAFGSQPHAIGAVVILAPVAEQFEDIEARLDVLENNTATATTKAFPLLTMGS